jgi:hypothetical protein
MKPLPLIATLVFASIAAQAEEQPLSTDLYECTPVYESTGARTVDQVHRTNIAVTRDKKSRPIGISVQHILVSGAVRTRNDQYTSRFETDGDHFFRWSGSLNGNQRIRMSGSLDRDPRSNGWMYSETQWDEGHFEWSARSTCHHVVTNATATSTPAKTENNNRLPKTNATATSTPAQTENNNRLPKSSQGNGNRGAPSSIFTDVAISLIPSLSIVLLLILLPFIVFGWRRRQILRRAGLVRWKIRAFSWPIFGQAYQKQVANGLSDRELSAKMRIPVIFRNFACLALFYIISGVILYAISSLYLSLSSSIIGYQINIGRISTEFTSNLLTGAVIPYSSVASGYFTAILSGEKKLSVGAVLENPYLYACIILVSLFGTDVALYVILLPISVLVQITTNLERPVPIDVVRSLDSRYSRPDPSAKIATKPEQAKSFKILARLGLWLIVGVSIAPLTAIFTVFMISTLIAGVIQPNRENIELYGLGTTLTRSFLSQLIMILPVALCGWVVVPPLLYAYRLVARIGKAVDPQPPDDGTRALYLRRFDRDRQKLAYAPRSFGGQMLSSIPGLRSMVTYAYKIRLEDSIINALAGSARLIAIGDPHEGLPMLGAYRIYVGAEDWKDNVRQLTRAADIVILIIDFSTAVEWEIEMVMSSSALPRTALVLPEPKRGKDWYQHWTALRQKGFRLPEVNDKTAVVVFTREGEPVRIDAIGHWRYWADATSASLVEGLSNPWQSNTVELDFGPWVRGSTIMRLATVILSVAFIVGYLIPMIGVDVMQYFDVIGRFR